MTERQGSPTDYPGRRAKGSGLGQMKVVEQDGVTALLLTAPEREVLRKALTNVKPKTLEQAEGIVVQAAVKLLARVGPLLRG